MNQVLVLVLFISCVYTFDNCFYRASDRSEYFLTALNSEGGYSFTTHDPQANYTYYVDICSNTPKGDCTIQTPVCQVVHAGHADIPAALGRLSTQRFIDYVDGAPNKGVSIIYKDGETCNPYDWKPRETLINIKCNNEIQSTIITKVTESSSCNYTIYMESPYACPFTEYSCRASSAITGLHYDLRGLVLPDTGNDSYVRYDDGNKHWGINICGATSYGCAEGSAVCQRDIRPQDTQYYSCGDAATTFITENPEIPGTGVSISYSSGSFCYSQEKLRSSTININCDLKGKNNVLKIDDITETPVCNYIIDASSINACPDSLQQCSFTASDGSHYNLQGLYLAGNAKDYSFKNSQKDWLFDLNICGNALKSSCVTKDNFFTPVCQTVLSTAQSFSLGSLATQKFMDYSKGVSKGVSISYTDGQLFSCEKPRQVVLNVLCNPSVSAAQIVSVNEIETCSYEINIESAFGCPVSPSLV